MFDFSSGEPDERFVTMHRILDVSDPIVLRQLVINHHIEKIVLVESRAEGEHITERGFPNNVDSVFTLDYRSIGSKTGGLSISSLRLYEGPPRLIDDVDAHIR